MGTGGERVSVEVASQLKRLPSERRPGMLWNGVSRTWAGGGKTPHLPPSVLTLTIPHAPPPPLPCCSIITSIDCSISSTSAFPSISDLSTNRYSSAAAAVAAAAAAVAAAAAAAADADAPLHLPLNSS